MKKVIAAGHICLDITPVFPPGHSCSRIGDLLIPGRLIRMELKSKGVSEEEIEGALGLLSDGREEDAAKELLQKYMRGKTIDVQTLQKACRYLLSKGFDYDTAKAALSAFGECEE